MNPIISQPTTVNNINSMEIAPDDLQSAIVAGRLLYLNDQTSEKQVVVTNKGAEPQILGSGELDLYVEPGQDGKTLISYYQFPNDDQAPLQDLKLELTSRNGGKKTVTLNFDEKNKVADEVADDKLRKVMPNYFQTEVEIPEGIYGIRAVAANVQKAVRENYSPSPSVAFDSSKHDEVGRNLALTDEQRKAA